MIRGLDSAFPPTAAQARAAGAAGVKLWSGYLQSRPNVGLYHPWSQANFENARLAGSTPIAFCSGWDDPLVLRQLAQRWNVRLCLDVEGGIRPDGSWVQHWLDVAGAGLYGNLPVHSGRRAAFHILAAYPFYGALFPPSSTWSGPRPPGPCGWQYRGTHVEFGVGVDSGNYDDFFGTATANSAGGGTLTDGGLHMDADVHAAFVALQDELTVLAKSPVLQALGRIEAAIKAQAPVAPADLSKLQTSIDNLAAVVTKIENALKAA